MVFPHYSIYDENISYTPYIKGDIYKNMSILKEENNLWLSLSKFTTNGRYSFEREKDAIDYIKTFFGKKLISLEYRKKEENERLKNLIRYVR